MGRGISLRVNQPCLTAGDRGPALPNFGVPCYLCVHPLTQNYTKFDVVTHMSWGGGLFLGVSHAPTQRGRGPSALQFLGFKCTRSNSVTVPMTVSDFTVMFTS